MCCRRFNDKTVKDLHVPELQADELRTINGNKNRSILNTSFVERLNLTIRQGSAYLTRRSLSHARWKDRLADHIELLRFHYNFARPHRALKFGREMRTPAMQAGLTTRRLTYREIFCSPTLAFCRSMFIVVVGDCRSGSRRAA